jgi:hypothetical protein
VEEVTGPEGRTKTAGPGMGTYSGQKEGRVTKNLLQETRHVSSSPSSALIGHSHHPRLISSPQFHITSNLTHFFHEEGDSVFLRNADTHQLYHMVLKPRRPYYESFPLQIREIETIV